MDPSTGDHFHMLVIAHRGANKEALENSWTAFQKAIEGGASRIELDVQLSRDGHGVIVHDDKLGKTVASSARVSELTRSEIEKLRLLNNEKIPFLDEVISELLPKVELNIELKGNSPQLAQVTGKLLERSSHVEKVIVSAFEADPLLALMEGWPEIKRACLWGTDTLRWPWIADFAPPVFLEKCRTKIIHPWMDMIDENLMDQAKARGWLVYGWASMVGEDHDREAKWANLKRLGVDGLCTNWPRQFKIWLEEAEHDEAQRRS